jgi:hypothetical protein
MVFLYRKLKKIIKMEEKVEVLTVSSVDAQLKLLSEQPKTEEKSPIEGVVEQVAEVVVEKPIEEKPKEVIETEEIKTNTLFDKLNEVTKTTETPKVELSDDVKKILADLEAARNQVETYKNNPLVKAMELGQDVREIAKKLVANDTSKLSFEQLLEAKIKKEFNLEGDDLLEAVQEEMSTIENKSRLERASIERELRNEFSSSDDSNSVLKELMDYEASVKANQLTPEQIQANNENIVKSDLQAIESVGNKLIDGEIDGVKFTREFVDSVKSNYNMNELAPYINEKTQELDAAKFMTDKFILQNWQKIRDSAVEAERGKLLRQVSNPDKTGRGTSVSSGTVDALTENQKAWGINTNQKVINID